jgi:hypothetical protein
LSRPDFDVSIISTQLIIISSCQLVNTLVTYQVHPALFKTQNHYNVLLCPLLLPLHLASFEKKAQILANKLGISPQMNQRQSSKEKQKTRLILILVSYSSHSSSPNAVIYKYK